MSPSIPETPEQPVDSHTHGHADDDQQAASRRRRRSPWYWLLVAALVVVIGFLGWQRVGMLDLPSVPGSVTLASSGLDGLAAFRKIDVYLRGDGDAASLRSLQLSSAEAMAVEHVRSGLHHVQQGTVPLGLDEIRQGIRRAPGNLVLGNAYRMAVFQLQRAFLHQASVASQLAPAFPPHLQGQPVAFFEALYLETGAREAGLQLALAWVDQMLLFPALEIKAPASVESVNILTNILEDSPGYVPALFARGLNHLHRPARLVWPESISTPADAAARDIGRCVAIGRRFDTGTPRLRSLLALTLGDAYVKAGRYSVARSWWQIAQNISHDGDIQEMVRRRYSWKDAEVLDRLEEELDGARLHLDVPMTDLAFVWS